MADTKKLSKHIHEIEDKMFGYLSSILNELNLPEGFNLNDIDINIIECKTTGNTKTTYILDKITLDVKWKPERY